MALSTTANTYNLRAPTAYRKQTAPTLGNKRAARVQASAVPEQQEGSTSRRDVAKAVLVAAPFVAGLVPSAALAFGGSNVTKLALKADDSTGIGKDKLAAIAIFKYLVVPEKAGAFEKAFADVKNTALNEQPPVPGLFDFTFFQEADTPIGNNTYFSVAAFKTEEQGRAFVATKVVQDFIKKITGPDIGAKFFPNGAIFKG